MLQQRGSKNEQTVSVQILEMFLSDLFPHLGCFYILGIVSMDLPSVSSTRKCLVND